MHKRYAFSRLVVKSCPSKAIIPQPTSFASQTSEEVMEKINAEKQKGMTFYGLNIVDSSTVGQYMRDHMEEIGEFLGSPTNVCDSMWEYENGICKETKKIENKQSD